MLCFALCAVLCKVFPVCGVGCVFCVDCVFCVFFLFIVHIVGFVCLHVRFCFLVSGCVGFWTCEFWVCEICCLCVLCNALCVLCVAVIDLRLSGLGILRVVSVLICAFSSHGDDVCIFVVCFLLCY